jgi:O-antigen ligase
MGILVMTNKKMGRTALNKILIIILIGVIPILWSNKTLDPNISIQFTGLTFLLLIFSLIQKKIHFKINFGFCLLFVLFICYSFVTLVISSNDADGFFRLSQYLLFFYLTLTLLQLENPDKLFNTLARTTVFISILVSIPAIFQLAELIYDQNLTIPQSTYKIKSIFPHRNLFSHFSLLILPFSIYLFFEDKKIWRYASLTSISLGLFLIVILSNRTSWLSLIAILIFLLAIFLIKRNVFAFGNKNNWLIAVLIVFIIVFALLFQLKFSENSSLKSHSLNSLDYNQGSTKDRLELWKRTILLIKEKPLIGHGIGSWKINMLKYGNEGLVSENNITFYQRPHNDFLWVAAEQGIIGLILYTGSLIIVLFQLINSIRFCDKRLFLNQLIVFASVLISFLIISNFSFPRERISHNIILFSSIGLFLNLNSRISEGKKYKSFKNKGTKYASLFLLTIVLVLGAMRYHGEVHTKNATIARKNGDYKTCIIEIEKAQSLIYQIDETSTPLTWQTGLSYFHMRDYDNALKFFKEAIEINPYHIYVLNDYAGSLSKLHKYDDAIEAYLNALKISPSFQDARLNLIALYYKQKNYYAAFEALKGVNLVNIDDRLKKTIILVIRKLLEYELSKGQPNIDFIHLYKKEYNNFTFYKTVLKYTSEPDNNIIKIIENPEFIINIIKNSKS